jgi:uncharacterized protein YebE (UPF0316 family)
VSSDLDLWVVVGIPVLIFCARVTDVALGTMRIVLVSKGQRTVAPLVGFAGILVWLVALCQVIQNLDRPQNYLAYAAGYATGTRVGLLLDEKLALGLLSVRVITRQDAKELIERLRQQNFGVTSVAARGWTGRARLIFTVVRRRDLRRLQQIIQQTNPKAFVSVSDVRQADEGFLGPAARPYPRMLAMFRPGK